MYCELLPILDKVFVVLNANRRLCHHLHQEFNRYQHSRTKKIFWHTPKILPLNSWLADSWKQHEKCYGTLLSDFQEHCCWETIIRNSKNTSFFLSTNATAAMAKEAWSTLTLWNTQPDQLDCVNEEVSMFVEWAREFQQKKEQNQWLCHSELPTTISQLITNYSLTLPSHILLAGFDEFSPAVDQLIHEIQAQTKVTRHSLDRQALKLQQIRLADEDDEILTMARWAKKQRKKNPNQRIGCVVPNLTQQRKSINRIFTNVFAPTKNLPGTITKEVGFDISAGQALNTFPIIQCALNALTSNPGFIAFKELSQLLRSVYINTATDDACLAAKLENKIRNLNQLHIDATKIEEHLAELAHTFPSGTFPARWKAFIEAHSQSSPHSPSEWSSIFINELGQLGWPGQRQLTSFEYQVVNRFEKVFEEFAETEVFTPTVSRKQALYTLQQLLRQTIFQPENNEENIQILGVLEAAGIEFDALWVMGLNNENWPPPAKPNPFIPIHLQRQKRMPHASANRELEYTQDLQRRLFSSAAEIIVSSPIQEKDKQLSPSRLIQHIPMITLDELNLPPYETLVEIIFATKQTEIINDNVGPKLERDETFRGGAWILQQQALCPFRAFAAGRLKAEALPEPQLGLTASERGTLVHEALEQIWNALKTQDYLKSCSQAYLKKLIEKIVFRVTHNYPSKKIEFLKIEKKRITTLLMEWLDFEKERPHFEVSQRESVRFIKLGELSLQLKIDRIDTLADGSKLIIDYKTGIHNNIYDWFGDPPKNIQLPLYCVYGIRDAFGLAYAQVRSGNMVFKGLINYDETSNKSFSSVLPIAKFTKIQGDMDWETTLTHWKQSLHTLGASFYKGNASVDPIDHESACLYCDLQPLCRIGSQDGNT